MIPFKELIRIVRSFKNKNMDDYGYLTGNLFISDKKDFNILAKQECLSDGDPIVCIDFEKPIEIGDTIKIEIPCLRIGYGLIFRTFNDMLLFPRVHIDEPHKYYLLDMDYLYSEIPSADSIIIKYRAIIRFVSVLKKYLKFYDDVDDMNEIFTFFIVRPDEDPNLIKFHIPIKFSQKNLEKVDPEILNKLSEVLVERLPEKHFQDALLSIINEMTKDSKAPFIALLEKTPSLLNGE